MSSEGWTAPLVVGSGIAGLFVALRCRELGLRPELVTKSRLEESNTRYAQGGIAAAVGEGDTPERHWRDTRLAGGGLVDPRAARALTFEAPQRIADLVRFGVPFDTVEGRIALGREAAHTRPRILHAGGDATGLHIEETLRRRVLAEGIEVRERTFLGRLEVPDPGGLAAELVRADGNAERIEGRPVVLATGGAGGLFRQSSNPTIATGDGLAVAFRAGALLSNMEFIQFHPTAFARPGAPRFLITEALRGEGAVLRNEAGHRFLRSGRSAGELAPRDVLTRALHRELERTGRTHVYLDATAIPRDRLYSRFPTVCRFVANYGLDLARDLIPVAPAAHYTIGGVATDLEARTSLSGLLACGEVASTGVHGANRLASNSLLEGLVFGERAVRQLLHPSAGGPTEPRRLIALPVPPGTGRDEGPEDVERVRDILWDGVGIVRTRVGLRAAAAALERIGHRAEPKDGTAPGPGANAALTGRLIARAALAREESRGAHFRQDYPTSRPRWRETLGVRRTPPRPAARGRR